MTAPTFSLVSKGDDTLTGAGGTDTFVFNTKLNASTNVDHIADFSGDTIELAADVFGKIWKIWSGVLSRDFYWEGNNAHDRNDHIIYNSQNGKIFYDPDGTGAKAKVLFAIVDNAAHLNHSDFLIG